MRILITLRVVIILLLFLLSSCATTEDKLSIESHNFNERLINNIAEGKTTKQEILRMFGSPQGQSIVDKTDTEKFVYIYQWIDEQESKIFTKQLTILFENSIVKKLNYIEKEDIKGERKTEKSDEKIVPLKIIGF